MNPLDALNLGANRIADGAIDQYAKLPIQMRQAKRWLLYRLEPAQDPSKKARKVPYYANGKHRRKESDEDSAQLATFNEAKLALLSGRYTGLGFALGQDDTGNYWQGIDLDSIDSKPDLGLLANLLISYVEASPSGKGVHAIGYGEHFRSMGSNSSGIEAYCTGRYFTVTGAAVRANPIVDLSDFIDAQLRPTHAQASRSLLNTTPGGLPARILGNLEDIPEGLTADLTEALNYIDADSRETWVRMGQALKTLGDAGHLLFMEYSARSDKHDPEADEKTWESFKPTRTSYKTVFAEAASVLS